MNDTNLSAKLVNPNQNAIDANLDGLYGITDEDVLPASFGLLSTYKDTAEKVTNSENSNEELTQTTIAYETTRIVHSKDLDTVIADDPVEPVQEDEKPAPVYRVRQAARQPVVNTIETPPSDPNAVTLQLKNNKHKVEIKCSFNNQDGTPVTFCIKFLAWSVNQDDTCLNIIMDPSISIKPPILSHFEVIIDGQSYTVFYGGGSYDIGQIKGISFIKVK